MMCLYKYKTKIYKSNNFYFFDMIMKILLWILFVIYLIIAINTYVIITRMPELNKLEKNEKLAYYSGLMFGAVLSILWPIVSIISTVKKTLFHK